MTEEPSSSQEIMTTIEKTIGSGRGYGDID